MMNGLMEVMEQGYFDQDGVKRYVYVQLMTIKTILISKGIVTEEEFDSLAEAVEKKVSSEIRQQLVNLRQGDSKEAKLINVLESLFPHRDAASESSP